MNEKIGLCLPSFSFTSRTLGKESTAKQAIYRFNSSHYNSRQFLESLETNSFQIRHAIVISVMVFFLNFRLARDQCAKNKEGSKIGIKRLGKHPCGTPSPHVSEFSLQSSRLNSVHSSCIVGLPKQSNSYQSALTCLCFGKSHCTTLRPSMFDFVSCDRIVQREYSPILYAQKVIMYKGECYCLEIWTMAFKKEASKHFTL